MDGRITLIVKAANQSVPDHRLECDTDWTVLALKDHLSTIHPSKPRVDEQRLIYSGQLLLDDLRLRSVLRHPTENNSYTVHLVCSPPRNPAPPTTGLTSVPVASRRQASPRGAGDTIAGMTVPQQTEGANPPTSPVSSSDAASSVSGESTDGLRRRTTNVTSDDASGATHQGIEAAAGYPTQAQVSMGVLQASADPIQQMATMQQMYANYMAYMQYIQMGGGLAGGVPWPQQMLHQLPASPPNPSSPAQSAASAAAAVADQSDQQQQMPDQNVAANQQQQQQQPQAPQAPQIRMNAQGGEVDDDEENEGLGRDWLDWIYVLSRMIVLLSVVYFYSTVSRFMIVVCIALLLYLYQAGWFRPARRAPEQQAREGDDNEMNEAQDDRNNNINNNNNNNEVPERLQADEAAADRPPARARPDEAEAAEGGTEGGTEAEGLHVRPSLLALSWTFLTTFFTSLIPEQPQVI